MLRASLALFMFVLFFAAPLLTAHAAEIAPPKAITLTIHDVIEKAQDLVKRYRVGLTPPDDPTQTDKMAVSRLSEEHDLTLRRLKEELEIDLRKAERDYAWKAASEDNPQKIAELQDQLRTQIQDEYENFRVKLLAEIYRYLREKDALKP